MAAKLDPADKIFYLTSSRSSSEGPNMLRMIIDGQGFDIRYIFANLNG